MNFMIGYHGGRLTIRIYDENDQLVNVGQCRPGDQTEEVHEQVRLDVMAMWNQAAQAGDTGHLGDFSKLMVAPKIRALVGLAKCIVVEDAAEFDRHPDLLNHRRAPGDHHYAVLRNLPSKLLGHLWCCLINNQPWNEHAAWPTRQGTARPAAV
jgi:hypothetical protein